MPDHPPPAVTPGSRSTAADSIPRHGPPELTLTVDVRGSLGETRYTAPVASLAAAQAAFLHLRTALDAGASRIGDGMVTDAAGVVVARISWNGRVWAGRDWQRGDRPILEAPRAGGA